MNSLRARATIGRGCGGIAAFALACAIALAGGGDAAAAAPSAGCSAPPAPHRFFSTFQVDGAQRSALINVPPTAVPGVPLPLVLMYHGSGSTGPETERTIGLTQVGDRFGFIVVYPDGNGSYWNLATGPARENADVTFTRELLDQLDGELCVDDSRVYAAGGSWGGGFVSLVACELSDRIAAFATVAGIYGIEPACRPQRPLPVLEVHGTDDPTVPYNGSARIGNASVGSFLAQWRQFDGCPARAPVVRPLGPHVRLESWAGCAAGTSVAHVRLAGESHVWPRPVPTNRVPFDASLALWEFFSTQTVQRDTVPPPRRHRHRHAGAMK
jgi:polyhydroxybutyrate depolymerase